MKLSPSSNMPAAPPSPSKSRKSSTMKVPAVISAPISPVKTPMSPTKAPLGLATSIVSPSVEEKKTYNKMLDTLGKGPMRFGPPGRPLVVKELLMRKSTHLEAYVRLKLLVEQNTNGLLGSNNNHNNNNNKNRSFTDKQVVRVAAFTDFNVDKSIRLIKSMEPLYWNISISQLEPQLNTQAILPLPQKLMSKDKTISSFFYMKPSRYNPSQRPTSAILANLLYVMDALDRPAGSSSSAPSPRNKIGCIINMNDWRREHFGMEYWHQCMDALQGKKGPVKVDLLLMVNPPSWFDKAWQQTKPILSDSFRRKVVIISNDSSSSNNKSLSDYLATGYENFLPDELGNGRLDVDELVEDFLRYREYIETKLHPDERAPTKESGRLVTATTTTTARAKRASSGVSRRQTSLNGSMSKKKQIEALAAATKQAQMLSSRSESFRGLSFADRNFSGSLTAGDRNTLARVSRFLTRASSSRSLFSTDTNGSSLGDATAPEILTPSNHSRRQFRSDSTLPLPLLE